MASRIVLITGVNSGVGLATKIAIAGASDKYHGIVVGRSVTKVNDAMSHSQASDVKGSISTVQLDVTDGQSISSAARHIKEKHGHLDVLINNAGILSLDSDVGTRFEQCMNTNVVGPAWVAAAFRPLLLENENPYSIWVNSATDSPPMLAEPDAVNLHPEDEAYRASKAALNMVAIK